MAQAKYLVIIEKHESNYNALVPNAPGVFGAGDTVEEVLEDVKSALELWIAYRVEKGGEVPEASFVSAEFVEVDVPAPATQAS